MEPQIHNTPTNIGKEIVNSATIYNNSPGVESLEVLTLRL